MRLVAITFLRQTSGILALDRRNLFFQPLDVALGSPGFLTEKIGGLLGTFLPRSRIFTQVPGDEFVGDDFRLRSVSVSEANREGDREGAAPAALLDQGHTDVAAHGGCDLRYRQLRPPFRIEIVLTDQRNKIVGCNKSTPNDLDAFCRQAGHRRIDQVRRDVRLLDQNRAVRTVDRWKRLRDHQGERADEHGGDDKEPKTALYHPPGAA